MTSPFEDSKAAVQGLAENAERLGLMWGMRPATVLDFDFDAQKADAIYDGDTEPIAMTSLCGSLLPGFRVMGMSVPPSANYAISCLNVPPPGTLVLQLRATSSQSIADGGSGDFVQFATQVHNWFGSGFTAGQNTRYQPTVAGWYSFVARVVFTSNATSRRGCFINLNGTTGTPGTLGGQSLQAPATGTCQVQAAGAVFMNGTTDYVVVRALQNSGAPLTLSNGTDNGSTLEAYYSGAFRPQPR